MTSGCRSKPVRARDNSSLSSPTSFHSGTDVLLSAVLLHLTGLGRGQSFIHWSRGTWPVHVFTAAGFVLPAKLSFRELLRTSSRAPSDLSPLRLAGIGGHTQLCSSIGRSVATCMRATGFASRKRRLFGNSALKFSIAPAVGPPLADGYLSHPATRSASWNQDLGCL